MMLPRWLLLVLLGGSAAAAPAPTRLPFTLRFDASTTWAENINHASNPADWIDTMRSEARVSGSLLTPLATGVSLISGAEAGVATVPRFARNGVASAGVRSALRWKFGLGPFAPVVTTEAALSHRAARIDDDRSWLAAGSIVVAKRFSESWRASLTGDWNQNYAAGPVFDTRAHRLLGQVSWDVTERWQLTYGRGSLWGDVNANASGPTWSRALAGLITPAIGVYYPTLSYRTTDSFGRGYVTYRFKARADFWWLELAPALGSNTSLPLRYESTFTVNFVGVKYRQDVWTLAVLHRF